MFLLLLISYFFYNKKTPYTDFSFSIRSYAIIIYFMDSVSLVSFLLTLPFYTFLIILYYKIIILYINLDIDLEDSSTLQQLYQTLYSIH